MKEKKVFKPFVFYTEELSHKTFFDMKSQRQRYIVKGYITTGELDLVNDIITEECLKDISSQFKNRNIKLDFDHETLRGENLLEEKLGLSKIPLGKAIDEAKDEKGNFVEFELNPNWRKFNSKGDVTMDFKHVWDSVKGRFFDSFSIAFIPLKTASKSLKSGSTARLLDKVNLINVALTGNPINPGATMTAVMAKSLKALNDGLLDSKKIKIEGESMTEEKKTEGKGEEAPAKNPEHKEDNASNETPPKQKEEKANKEVNEAILEIKSELKSIVEENKSLKAELKSLVEKARPKSLGAENKSGLSEAKNSAPKMVGPLDLI